MQVEAPNNNKPLCPKSMVVSVMEKGIARLCQVSAMETNKI